MHAPPPSRLPLQGDVNPLCVLCAVRPSCSPYTRNSGLGWIGWLLDSCTRLGEGLPCPPAPTPLSYLLKACRKSQHYNPSDHPSPGQPIKSASRAAFRIHIYRSTSQKIVMIKMMNGRQGHSSHAHAHFGGPSTQRLAIRASGRLGAARAAPPAAPHGLAPSVGENSSSSVTWDWRDRA